MKQRSPIVKTTLSTGMPLAVTDYCEGRAVCTATQLKGSLISVRSVVTSAMYEAALFSMHYEHTHTEARV
jgi:hypothetical protein